MCFECRTDAESLAGWMSALEILEKEKAAMRLQPGVLPRDSASLRRLITGAQERLRDLCNTWALTGKWPLMTPVENELIAFRLEHGHRMACRLCQKHALGRVLCFPGKAAALRWLVSDSWLPFDLEADVAAVVPPTDVEPPSSAPPSLGFSR